MIVYEVNLEVDSEIAEEFDEWLRMHAGAMAALPGFRSAALWYVEADGPRVHRCAQYFLDDRAALTAYLAGDAERMRADGTARFGGRFSASRRVLSPFAE